MRPEADEQDITLQGGTRPKCLKMTSLQIAPGSITVEIIYRQQVVASEMLATNIICTPTPSRWHPTPGLGHRESGISRNMATQ